MYNYLRTDAASALALDPATANGNGGVAIWDVPPTVVCANNPIVFTRTKYLFWIDGVYDSPFSFRPNVVSIVNGDLHFRYETESKLYFKLRVLNDDGEEEDVEECVYSGRSDWYLVDKNFTVTAILGVSLTGNGEDWTDVVEDDNYAYLIAGTEWSDDNHYCGEEGKTLYRGTDVDTAVLNVYRADGTCSTLSAESFDAVVRFDVSAIVRQWLDEDFAEMPGSLVPDGSLAVKFKIKGIGGTGWADVYLAVNAVSQIGESSDLTSYVGCVLSGFKRLSLYSGYELDYAVVAGKNTVTTALGAVKSMAVTRVRADNATALLGDEGGNAVGTESGEGIALQSPLDIAVIARCTPRSPFYVRWLNRLGGVDYFMFSRQQKITREVKSVSTYSPYSEDPAEGRTNTRNYALTGQRSVTVGVENIPEDIFNELEKMPFSPRIEWWNESLDKWIELSVSSFSGEYNTKYARSSFEVTFALPTINTQY